MKKVVYWLTLFLLFSHGAFAAPNSANHKKNTRTAVSCNFLGQRYTEVQYIVNGSPTYQEVYVSQGSKKPQVLWYTQDFKSDTKDTDYIFNEQSLIDNVQYEILFVNDADNKLARYYRRNLSAGNQYWQLIEEKVADLDNGNLTVIGEGEVSSLVCSSSTTVPEVPEIELDICEYVPNSAQTNNYVDGLPSPTSALNITSSGNFVYIPKASPTLSFANVSQITDNNCNVNGQQVICSVDPQLTFPDFPPELEDYDTSDATIYDDVECSGSCELKPGKYRNLSFITENATLILQSGSYYFNEMIFSKQNTQVAVKNNRAAEVHYKKIDFGNHDIKFNVNASAENFLLIGHGADADIDIVSANSIINGYVYVDPAAKNNGGFILSGSNTTITGGVSASSINIAGGGNHKIGQSNKGQCLSNTTDDDYTLVLSPETDIALVCEDITPTVSVLENGLLASDFNGTVVVTFDGSEQRYSGVSNQFTIQSGGTSRTVSVTAYIEGEQNSSVSGSYEFVPYKFAAADQYVIANKAENVEVKALACDDNGGVVDAGYSGLPVVQYSWATPSSGASGSLTYAPEFASGTANSGLVLDNAGKIEVSLEDTDFDCSGLADCPIEGRGALKGNFMVYSRPWTFALCSTNNTDLDSATGTSSGGAGFIAAGKEFDIRVVPVKYQSAIAGEVESNSAWCSASNITSNFFLDSSFSNHVKLSSEVATPDLHESNVLLASGDEMAKPRVNSDKEYKFTNLYWNDVGSLKVMASTENYSQTCGSPMGLSGWYECTQLGYRNIGRFYPKYFHVYKDDINTNEWAYPNSQSFTYMGQPFGAKVFYIEALSEKYTTLNNYKFFSDSLQAQFSLIESGKYAARFSTPKTYSGSWEDNGLTGVNSRSIGRFEGTVSDGIVMVKDTTSYKPDGPLNLYEISTGSDNHYTEVSISELGVSANVDPVVVEEGILAVQPDIRFGRVDLDDVGGSQGSTLHIPLRVEYWNGNRFIVNLDDSQTSVFGVTEKDMQQPIWPEVGSKIVTLGAGGEVAQGSSRSVTATEAEPYRQQTRVWLELIEGSNALPWLKYNWEEEGEGELVVEENPSSVVTFGIHRGNDRVIYRGEPGLTGQ